MSLDTGLPARGTSADAGEWECMECGYVEVGVKTQRPRKCPDCGAPSPALEFFPYGAEEDASCGEAQDEFLADDLDFDAASDESEDLRNL